MSLADVLGTPVHDQVAGDGTTQTSCRGLEYPEPSPPPDQRKRRSSIMAVGIIVALATGLVAGWFGSGLWGAEAAIASSTENALPVGVANQAELFTALHLSGALDEQAASDAVWVNQTAAVSGEQIDGHTWQVTVAVDSLELIDGTYEATELQYFSVVVSTTGGQPTASGVPARIPAPARVASTESLFSEPVPQDQATTAIGFLEQYLTGGSELNRYLALPAGFANFESAPYHEITAQPLGANSLGQIRVAVAASKENGITHQLEFVLTLAIADGVWVIEDVAAAVG